MAIRKEMGRIVVARLGTGGYQDACFGFTFHLTTNGGAVGDFWGFWAYRPPGAEWTEAQQTMHFGKAMTRALALMNAAKVITLNDLVGKPVEITFDGTMLLNWRILTEVL